MSGAEFTVVDEAGNEVFSFTTDNELSELKYLEPETTYTLHEVTAPEGFEPVDDIIFIVHKDGTIDAHGKTLPKGDPILLESKGPAVEPVIEKIDIVIPDSVKREYLVGEEADFTGIEITVSMSDNTQKTIEVTADMITGFDSSAAVENLELTVQYKTEKVTYSISVKEAPKKVYTITGDSAWTPGTDMTMVVKSSFDDELTFGLFRMVKIGDAQLPESAYEGTSGSLNLTIKDSYLQTLTSGEHVLTVVFEDGEAEMTIEISEPEEEPEPIEQPIEKEEPVDSPKTADSASVMAWIFFAAMTSILSAVVVKCRGKHKAV